MPRAAQWGILQDGTQFLALLVSLSMNFMHAKLVRLSPKIDEDRSNMSSASDVVVMSHAHRKRENEGRWRTDLNVTGFFPRRWPCRLLGCRHAAQFRNNSLNSLACLSPSRSYFAVACKLVCDAVKKRCSVLFVLTEIAELQHCSDERTFSFSPLGVMLTRGGTDDTNGLVSHKFVERAEVRV